MNTIMSGFSSAGNLLNSATGLTKSQDLGILQAGTTGLDIMSKLGAADASGQSYYEKAQQFENQGVMALISGQGQADTAQINADATVQQILQSAFAGGLAQKTGAATTATRGATQALLQGLQTTTAGQELATRYGIAAGDATSQAQGAFASAAPTMTSLKTQLAQNLGRGMAASGGSGLDVGAAQGVGQKQTAAEVMSEGATQAQALMRYAAGMGQAQDYGAMATAATQGAGTQAGLTTALAGIAGQRGIAEGGISADLLQKQADIATPVATLKGNLAGQLAMASAGVAQAQDQASAEQAILAGQQAKQAGMTSALGTGLMGALKILGL
jgi:hypothetical protein